MTEQLDLFRDSRAVGFVNEIVAALEARDAQRATAALADLRSRAPEDANVPGLEFLTRALAQWRTPIADAQAIAAAARRLDAEIAPAARRTLGAAGSGFVAGFFRELADAALGLAYSAAQPTAHRAWLCLRAGAWEEADAAAASIPHAATTPDALHWLSCARYRREGLAAARSTLFSLAWHAPERLATTFADLDDELLERDWQRFCATREWTDIDETKLPAWFPAWYVIEHPITRTGLDYFNAPATKPAEAARLLNHILELESRGDWRKLALSRENLRNLNEDLFDHYMARRWVHHR